MPTWPGSVVPTPTPNPLSVFPPVPAAPTSPYVPPVPGTVPGSTSGVDLWGQKGLQLGANLGTAELALGGLQTIGNLWSAWNANKLAKEQFDFQKKMATANYENSAAAYNTELWDRNEARQSYTGISDADAQAYIDANKLRTSV